jgi:thiopeptide-type bacteriocin biosynthesis protein
MTEPTSKYLSVHLFYNTADLRPVIMHCIDPIVSVLEEKNLISRFFFVRYWEGGTHVRLRLLPRLHGQIEEIRQTIEPLISRFIQERPSLFDADSQKLVPIMQNLFEIEYGSVAFHLKYGTEGYIPLAINNSFSYVPYEPEYKRYGGPAGVEIAEKHFHVASMVALQATRDTNSQIRASLLGMSLQLMLHLVWAFVKEKREAASFFRFYSKQWESMGVTPTQMSKFDKKYEHQAKNLTTHIYQAEKINKMPDLIKSPLLSQWLTHTRWLRENVTSAYELGALKFEPAVASETEAFWRLLTSFIHMMNNRLGVHIREEVYLAHQLSRALEDINGRQNNTSNKSNFSGFVTNNK